MSSAAARTPAGWRSCWRRWRSSPTPAGSGYWELLGVINGWPPYPARVPTLEHVVVGLRAHGWVAAALRAHG